VRDTQSTCPLLTAPHVAPVASLQTSAGKQSQVGVPEQAAGMSTHVGRSRSQMTGTQAGPLPAKH